MVRKAIALVSIFMAMIAAGCSDSSSSNRPNDPGALVLTTVDFEIVHASQDAPPVNITVGGSTVATGADFGDSAFITTTAGDITIEVEGIIPGGNQTVISATDTFADGQRVTILAADEVANIGPIVLVDDQPAVAATDVRLRVVHAASNVTPIAAMVDIYVTGPGDAIDSVPPITLMFGQDNPAVTVPEGDYRIRVTPAGVPGSVVFDSGTVPLAGGSDLVVAAIANVGPGTSPIELLVTTGNGALRIISADTPADLRVAHLSPDAGVVDVIANDDFANPAVPGLAYTVVTDYRPLGEGPINFKVVPSGLNAPVAIDTLDTVSLVAGETYSVFATGLVGEGSIGAEVVVDNPRRIATESKVRIFHASPAAGNVDIYVVGPGASIDDVDPDLGNVPFFTASDYISLAPGAYDVVITAPGSKVPALPRAAINVAGGGIYTAIASDAAGGGAPVSLTLADDFVP